MRFSEFVEDGPWSFMTGGTLFEQINNKDHNSDLPILAITQEHGAVPRDQIDYHVSVSEKSIGNYKVVEPGDFIISLRSFQGGIEFSRYLGLCSPAYVILRLRQKGIHLYFKHILKTERFIQELSREIEGIRDGKMVSYKQFSSLRVPLPPSFGEQEKIAECLSSVDELINSEEMKLDALKEQKTGLMQNLFPTNGDLVPNLRFSEFVDSGPWSKKEIRDFAHFVSGYGFPKKYQGKKEGQFPFYKVSDISNSLIAGEHNISRAANYIDHPDLKELRAQLVPVGSTIFARIGEAIRLNRRVMTTIPCVIDNNVGGLKCIEGQATDLFVYYVSQLLNLSEYSGGAVPSVNKSTIEQIPVACPELSEQERITDCLSTIDDLIAWQTKYVTQLRVHKNGLLHRLFPEYQGV
ncbi:restriction endonuclease subunit S [uncultured Tateyamaria sp.]|uniref:restriction endonuclease subunit S n=1 Tax=uncultured Tateyamaria sp. TaxID=455651 RepID=UPI00260DB098|nr:restriction endonuclease subunit S [uncultured Tateyamaria sp.]